MGKKVCIKGKEFNTNYHEVYGEEKAITDGYSVFDVPEGKEDCCFQDFDKNGFNIELYNARKEREQKQIQVAEKDKYLKDTDYIDNKLIEAYILGDNKKLEELKTIYAEQLTLREEARNFIDKFGG